jgi:hypothetical protein
MKRTHWIPLALLITTTTITAITGCAPQSAPPPPLDTSMDLGAHEPEKLPYVDPSLPSGDLEKATDIEREHFIKLQRERMKKQQDEVDDLRRQKFQDGYYDSRYPSDSN